MFGCHAVYVEDKIVFILRDRKDHVNDNGVWIATTKEHHQSLKEDFPSMRSIQLFGAETTGWQVLPLADDEFEPAVTKACELVLQGDIRIGKIPNS